MSDLSQGTINEIWRRMGAIYGHRWTSAYTDDPTSVAGQTWAVGLAGVTGTQIAAGFHACIASADGWPPSLPEFRARCLCVPSLAVVRAELSGKGERGAFARLVWSHLDPFRWRQSSAETADRMMREAYEAAREHVMRGGALPEVAPALAAPEEPKPKPADPEVVERIKRELDAKLRASEPAERELEPNGETE